MSREKLNDVDLRLAKIWNAAVVIHDYKDFRFHCRENKTIAAAEYKMGLARVYEKWEALADMKVHVLEVEGFASLDNLGVF